MIKLFETCDILKINENIIYLAWFIGSKYKMHSGDAIKNVVNNEDIYYLDDHLKEIEKC